MIDKELIDKFGKHIINADVKDFICKLEQYDGSYIDKRFWESRFWKQLKSGFV